MSQSSPALQSTGLTKWYGQIIAVNELSFSADAPVIGLLGPNGAGKSTLIKLLVGQLKPSAGQVRLLGQTPWANPRLMSQLGYCPEHDRFYEHLSARAFVEVLTRLHGFGPQDAAALCRQALEDVGLLAEAERPIRTLSHGMRQRLKLAQALAHRPRVLILDEPLSGMDPLHRARTVALIRARADAGVTILVSSHVLHELGAMTDHILLLNRGRLLAEGQVQQIRDLIDGHPHRIALACDRLRDLGRELLRHEDVVRVEIDRDRLIVETRSPDECYARIGELAAAGEFDVQSMISLDDNLEAVFRYLVR